MLTGLAKTNLKNETKDEIWSTIVTNLLACKLALRCEGISKKPTKQKRNGADQMSGQN